MDDLEAQLRAATNARRRLIVTDGVFSMDGRFAKLDEICTRANRHDALVMVDDSHAVGFIGASGRGTPELHRASERVDILTGTLGKALGGASGGYVSGRREIIAMLRQRSRPYLFSNSLAPPIVAAALEALDKVERADTLRRRLAVNAAAFRERLTELGLNVLPGQHPIVPVMLGDAVLASKFVARLLEHGVYASAFSYPVVPQHAARIRTQVSAAHTGKDLREAAEAFGAVRDELLN
jgi:glycine C-acetyltransferase